ncbi:GAF domain-containing sensor histidine kinase [Intrasporangium sp. YIM S08009]|uniref:sensor histidine kinase n=1 Tax=Intrasporangium zincisolvens TaxID=3080018 RepID=UPI002B054F2C|nr:GAF domain-containing sensor histidine kinase [Intrasporangium sp. YIM S08009]
MTKRTLDEATPALLPSDEPAHLRDALLGRYGVLESGPSRDLQALVDMAAQICAVPNAAINLITSTQQHQVATFGFEASICMREDSMCAVVLDRPEPVVVRNAAMDERFRDNPFVTGLLGDVRFYASAPLTTPGDVIIGRLCVFDGEPRTLTPEQEHALTVLADRIVDVLELRLRSRELEESLSDLTAARDELRRSNDLLSVFAGQVSHDLRSPLSAIMASAEMLGQRESVVEDPLATRLVGTTFRASTRMAGLIEEILTHARVGARLERTETDLDAVLSDVLTDLGPSIEHANATVMAEPLPTLWADGAQLYSVLLNLVSNALKYTRPDVDPLVTVTAVEHADRWRITVQDNGAGIDEASRESVFQLFTRASTAVEGSGIGLATCKRIVEVHGGSIGVDPAPEGGSRFWFELPTTPPAVGGA